MSISSLEKLNSKLMEPEKIDSHSSSHSKHLFKKVFDSINQAKMTIRDYLENPVPSSFPLKKISTYKSAQNQNIEKSIIRSGVEISEPQKNSSKITPEIASAIEKASQTYQVPQKLIQSMIQAESNFNPKATSPVGAMGLMQLMPKTAHELGVKNPYNVHDNIDGGVRYFRKLLDKFGQSSELALAAYNAGQGNVIRYGGIPPYRETQNYVSKIMKSYNSSSV